MINNIKMLQIIGQLKPGKILIKRIQVNKEVLGRIYVK